MTQYIIVVCTFVWLRQITDMYACMYDNIFMVTVVIAVMLACLPLIIEHLQYL